MQWKTGQAISVYEEGTKRSKEREFVERSIPYLLEFKKSV